MDSEHDKRYKLYICTNKHNGFKYIGITSMRVTDRIRAHFYEADNGGASAFKQALRTYGKSAFDVKIEITGLTETEAMKLEREYIEKYRTYIGFEDCQGYNSTLGGDGVHSVNDEYNKINQYGADGKLITIYNSLREAEDITGISRVGIANACDGRSISAGGYQWRRFRDTDGNDIDPEVCGMDRVTRKVSQYSMDGKFIKTFDTLQQAADEVGCSSSQISKVCRGKNKSTAGFKWKYYDQGDEDRELNVVKNDVIKRTVNQLDKNRNVIATYKSIAAASEATGIPKTTIGSAINNSRLSHGYYWESSTEYNQSRYVARCNQFGEVIEIYNSLSEASRDTEIARGAIWRCCTGKQITAGGYRWMYVD